MAKHSHNLILDPAHELHFKGPFTEVTTTHLKLQNLSEQNVAYKVKTTAPRTYCVRPNSGILEPHESVSISIMLQPCDPEHDDRLRDKFMVQSIAVPATSESLDSLWQTAPPESVVNKKLKCLFYKEYIEDSNEPPSSDVVPTSSSDVDSLHDAAKELVAENQQLKSRIAELRAENSAFKEEGLRHRIAASEARGPSQSTADQFTATGSLAKRSLGTNSLYYAIVAFIVGLLLGKLWATL